MNYEKTKERIMGRIEFPIFETDIDKIIDTEIKPLVEALAELCDADNCYDDAHQELYNRTASKILSKLGYTED